MAIVILIAIGAVLSFIYLVLIQGGKTEKQNYMCYEKCDYEDCNLCIDEPQCPFSCNKI